MGPGAHRPCSGDHANGAKHSLSRPVDHPSHDELVIIPASAETRPPRAGPGAAAVTPVTQRGQHHATRTSSSDSRGGSGSYGVSGQSQLPQPSVRAGSSTLLGPMRQKTTKTNLPAPQHGPRLESAAPQACRCGRGRCSSAPAGTRSLPARTQSFSAGPSRSSSTVARSPDTSFGLVGPGGLAPAVEPRQSD